MRNILFIFFIIPIICFGQQTKISGRVINKQKKGLEGVNIYISGSYDGGLSGQDGTFQFFTETSGKQILIFSKAGFTNYQVEIEVQDSVHIQASLSAVAEAIETIEIKAGQIQVGNKYNAVLSPLDIVTTAGTNGNIIAALNKLPGAQIAGEDGRLMVRGGNPNETQTYINGIQVFQPYTPSSNAVPVRGRFSPFLFKGTNFSTGGYGSEFGNALSGILNLNTAMEIESPKTELSFSTVGLGVSNTQQWKDNSISFNVNYTNLKPYTKLISQNITWDKPYQQASGEAIWRRKGKNSFFNLYGAYSFENFQYEDEDIEFQERGKTAIRSNNGYMNGTYQYYLPNNWKWELGMGIGYNKKNLGYFDFIIPNEQVGTHVKTLFRKSTGNQWSWMFGAEHQYEKFDESFTSNQTSPIAYGYKRNQAAVFSEGQYQLLPGLNLGLGIRYILASYHQQIFEPRASLGYVLNRKNQISFAYGKYHQEAPEPIAKFDASQPWSSAAHYIFNYSYTTNGKLLRLEGYYKNYTKLLTYIGNSPQYQDNFNHDGYGKVKGFDLFWKDSRSIRNFEYWISYSLTDANKKEANYPMAVQPSYVAKHQASIVAKYWFGSLRSLASLTNTYVSGRPYENPNLSGFMQQKTKAQNDLSVSWSYLLTQQKILHISFSNLLGNDAIYGYRYRTTADANGQFASRAITPTAKHFIFVGFFWTISQDKKDNQLKNL